MPTHPKIQIEQIDQVIDQLISQLFAFKETVADLRNKMAGVSTAAIPGDGILDEKQVAKLLNRREMVVQKRIERLSKNANKFDNTIPSK